MAVPILRGVRLCARRLMSFIFGDRLAIYCTLFGNEMVCGAGPMLLLLLLVVLHLDERGARCALVFDITKSEILFPNRNCLILDIWATRNGTVSAAGCHRPDSIVIRRFKHCFMRFIKIKVPQSGVNAIFFIDKNLLKSCCSRINYVFIAERENKFTDVAVRNVRNYFRLKKFF